MGIMPARRCRSCAYRAVNDCVYASCRLPFASASSAVPGACPVCSQWSLSRAYAPGLLDVAHDGIEHIGEKRALLDIRPAHETRIQIGLALVENLLIDSVERVLDAISGHELPFEFSSSY